MKIFLLNIAIVKLLFSQIYISADPYYLINYELTQFNNSSFHSTALRPFYINSNKKINVEFKNEIYFNNNASNQENMDLRYIGNGIGNFSSVRVSGLFKYFAFNFEPYSLKNNYIPTNYYSRGSPFTKLNDAKTNNNLRDIGLRKGDAYLHFNGLAIGWSIDNMWWGPGIQSSLSMTNNTTGFKNFMIGTIKELRWKNIGLMGRYTFNKMNNETGNNATYFTGLTGQITFYNEQIITIGLSRNYLTGGISTIPWSREKAKKIVFEDIFIKNLQKLDYTIAGHDPWDQTISGWVEVVFTRNRLKLFLEIGLNDNRFNFWDFVVQPDHAMASIIGLRKYGLFNKDQLLFGIEYANLIKGRHHVFRATPNWYERPHYDDFSYDDRRWGAHSGSDSDDLLIYFGFITNKWSFIPSFNFERHGVISHRPAEIKTEYKIDARYKINNYEFGIIYENQFEAHLGFPPDQYFIDEITGIRRTNTLIFKFISHLY